MDKITIQRANVVLDISPDQKDYYLNQGYNVINEQGQVIEETKSLTVEALNRKVAELQKVIDSKNAEIAKLKSTQTTPKRKTKGEE